MNCARKRRVGRSHVTETTGVPGADVAGLGAWLHHHSPATIMIGLGLQKCDHGADQARASLR